MALTDAYATPAEYRAQIEKSDSGDDTEILRNLTAVSRLIERETGRTFNKDATATVRIYTPTDRRLLEVDDIGGAVTSVTVDDDDDRDFDGDDSSLTATSQYELWPLNAATGPEPEPYTQIYRADLDWPGTLNVGTGSTRYYRVRVEAIYGWPSVPAPIKEACIWLTAILRLESPRSTQRMDEVGITTGTSRAANDIIERLKARYAKSTATMDPATPFFLV